MNARLLARFALAIRKLTYSGDRLEAARLVLAVAKREMHLTTQGEKLFMRDANTQLVIAA